MDFTLDHDDPAPIAALDQQSSSFFNHRDAARDGEVAGDPASRKRPQTHLAGMRSSARYAQGCYFLIDLLALRPSVISSVCQIQPEVFALETTKVNLAQEPDFTLGGVRVSPSGGLVSNHATEQHVTPLVMHALLVLFRADGRTVTRDDLIEACWEGRIVSEDAISRVISALRGLARHFDPAPFNLQTITKIGFRLQAANLPATPPPATDLQEAEPAAQPRIDAPSPQPDASRSPQSEPQPQPYRSLRRRGVLIGAAGTAVLVGVGAGGWWAAARRVPKPARDAIEDGLAAFRQATPDQVTQAIAAFKQATTLAPRHAQGWALLALAYRYQSFYGARSDEARLLAQRVSEAANRALSLDPDNAAALAALVTLRRDTDWIGKGGAVAGLLARHPRNFWANWVGMVFYTGTGQEDLALRCDQAMLATDPAWPKLVTSTVLTNWSMGRLNDADDWMARGVSQWPRHYSIWFARHRLLTYTGRAAQALAMLDDRDRRPVGIPEWNFEQSRLESQAMLTHAPADIAAATAGYRTVIPRGVGFAENALQFLSSTGQLDEAFAVLNALLLDPGQGSGRSRYSSEQGQYFNMEHAADTWMLWLPPVAAMRADPRMAPILRKIGLADYWRATRSRPVTPIAGI